MSLAKIFSNQRDVDSEMHPLLNGTAGPMVNRGGNQSFVLLLLALFLCAAKSTHCLNKAPKYTKTE